MTRSSDTPRVAMQVSRGVVVASIQVDLHEDVLASFQQDLLDLVHAAGARGLILEVSALETLDSEEFASLRQIMTMATIMGSQAVLVGLQPGVVSALVEMDVDVTDLLTAIDLDAAFALLEPAPDPVPEDDGESPDAEADDPADARDEEPEIDAEDGP